MLTYGYVFEKAICGSSWELISGEINELLESIESHSLAGIREELSDVMVFVFAYFYFRFDSFYLRYFMHHFPVLPGFGLFSSLKFLKRIRTWEKVAGLYGVMFNKYFLKNGSNFREWKIVAAMKEMEIASGNIVRYSDICKLIISDGYSIL